MWLLFHALDEDRSPSLYHRLLGICMKVFKLDKIMMITTNTIILFQMFIDPDPIKHKYIEDIRTEWATYFIEKRNEIL